MEITIISGKGGTGKTTISVALAELQKRTVKVDCDVEAPNLYLFCQGNDIFQEDFYGNKKAVVDEALCTSCDECEQICQFGAIKQGIINSSKCEGCGACVLVCPVNAISLIEEKSADVFITAASNGLISRAQMEIGSDGSGKLVTLLRQNGKSCRKDEIIINDGSPGIGCSVIASITGADAVLIVTEPTQSGKEDFLRIAKLCSHFGVKTMACINKYDLNKEKSAEIEELCAATGIKLVGKIPFDDQVLQSVNELKPIIFYENSIASREIHIMWDEIKNYLNLRGGKII